MTATPDPYNPSPQQRKPEDTRPRVEFYGNTDDGSLLLYELEDDSPKEAWIRSDLHFVVKDDVLGVRWQ